MFYERIAHHAENVALVAGERQVSYAMLLQEAERFAERIGPGRALVFLEAANSIESVAAYLACLIGGHPVHLFSGRDWHKTVALAESYRPNVVWHWRNGSLDEERPCDTAHELHADLRVLLSTSGSTGTPKFVKLSQRNIDANARSICDYLGLDAGERAVTGLQFNYSYGMSVLNSHLACGASLALTDLSATESDFWTLFRRHGGTSFAGVPYTFEMLDRVAFPWARTPGLRYATQAGGRLAPELVRKIAGIGERHGWRFYVMYGQTEAAPRMAYLPPDRASDFPGCIGIPVPGGEIDLVDEAGSLVSSPDIAGELVYRGPNVMMGYAQGVSDLARDDTPDSLPTGDIGCRNDQGLLYIVGRKARFIKPFGIRVNLDEVQGHVRQWAPGSACTGTDERIIVAVLRGETAVEPGRLAADLAEMYGLPAFLFLVVAVDEVPLLETGKIDYRRLLELGDETRAPAVHSPDGPGARDWVRVLLSPRFYQRTAVEAAKILGLARDEWGSIAHIFSTFIGARDIDGASTFSSLSGDSLSYIQTYIALEDYLGTVPDGWESMTVDELEGHSNALAL